MSDWKVSRTSTTTLTCSEYRCSVSVAVTCRLKPWSFGIETQPQPTDSTCTTMKNALRIREIRETAPAPATAHATTTAQIAVSTIPYRASDRHGISFPSRTP